MVRLGVHVSIAGGIDLAVERAAALECDAFQIFSRNPRGWRYRDITPGEGDSFVQKLKGSGMSPAVDHMPYLPNLASPKDDTYWRSVETLTAELKRCSQLGIPYLVTHLGSHLGRGWGEGARRIVGAIEAALSQSDSRVMLLLENTAGTKNSMGGSFEDIARIIEELGDERVGVCLDTCHLFAAGYELRTESAFEETMARFDECIGVERLKVVHLNDSQGAFGSRLDRHEHIGLGRIGEEGLMVVLRSRALRDLPFILETPIDGRRDDRGNLMAARELASNEPMISRT